MDMGSDYACAVTTRVKACKSKETCFYENLQLNGNIHKQYIRSSCFVYFVIWQIAAIMIGLFIVSWLPYALIAQFGITGLDNLVTPYSTEIPVIVAKASAIWNPIVYALTHPRYRVALCDIFPCCRIFLRRKLTRKRSDSRSDGGSQSGRRQFGSTTAGTPNVEMIPIDLSPTSDCWWSVGTG
jgi:hypothetical protein